MSSKKVVDFSKITQREYLLRIKTIAKKEGVPFHIWALTKRFKPGEEIERDLFIKTVVLPFNGIYS